MGTWIGFGHYGYDSDTRIAAGVFPPTSFIAGIIRIAIMVDLIIRKKAFNMTMHGENYINTHVNLR